MTSTSGTMVPIRTPPDCHNEMFAVSTGDFGRLFTAAMLEKSVQHFILVCVFFFFLFPAVKNIKSMINGPVICLEASIWAVNNKLDLKLTCKVKGKDSLLQWRKAEVFKV